MRRHRLFAAIAAFAVLLVAAWLLLYHECASGGAMAGAYRTCNCAGFEWLISDQIANDGPRRTVCLGWVTSRMCLRHRGGPQIKCSGAFP